ncbi:MAG TPA: hypothetical protein VGD17_09900 [Chitinophagaceae bacterium]
MEMYYLLRSGLLLHLVGITLLAGTMVASFATYRHIWQFAYNDNSRALLLVKSVRRLRLLQIIGSILILAGGMMMLAVYKHQITQQTWFKIKMVILILIILNPFILARPAAKKLAKALNENEELPGATIINGLRRKLNLYHIFQLLLFLIIFILSAYRIN